MSRGESQWQITYRSFFLFIRLACDQKLDLGHFCLQSMFSYGVSGPFQHASSSQWCSVSLDFWFHFICYLQATGVGESWNHIYTQSQPGGSCDIVVNVYNKQTFLHTFLSQKSKCLCMFLCASAYNNEFFHVLCREIEKDTFMCFVLS